ncbi:MAG: hypothetical protein Q9164_002574 [Protoblastenia rupestris]
MKTSALRLLAALSLTSSSIARIIPNEAVQEDIQQASIDNGGLSTEGTETLDGVPIDAIPEGRAAVPAGAQPLPAAGWTATADSFQPGYEPAKAIDNNAQTYWHTPWGNTGTFPHFITIDMKAVNLIGSISYQPRQDGQANGHIGGHTITLSTDGNAFSAPKVIGTWRDDATTKISVFEATNARYLRLTATTEAGNRGPWSAIAELQIYTSPNPPPAYNGIGGGQWSPTIDFPLVPVAAALEYNTGNLVTWSAYVADNYGGGNGGSTLTATYFPGSQTVSQRDITNTQHDMFCPGLNLDGRGRFFVTGGNNAPKTSVYTPVGQAWSAAPNMNTPRGYQSTVTLSDGRTFVIGGSWSGGLGNKNGEVYSISLNRWTPLPGCPVAPMLTQDAQGVYRSDNHAWLFGWKQGWVFQAGPSRAMNWYNPNGNGGYQFAGNRGNDVDAMCGLAAMYDAVAGKILAVGGAVNYQNSDATANAHIITLTNQGVNPQVQTINPMWYKRTFANIIVMPNGNVMIVGGQVYGQPFSDDTAQLIPEIWVRDTGNFIRVPPIAVPRTYHSIGILLADATVFNGGGGLCGGCATNHFDGQVYYPGYLFNGDGSRAARPVINTATAEVRPGGTITASTNVAVTSWSLIRVSSTTHTVNTDQRRVPLTATANGNTYNMVVPNDYGIVIPGYYMLFAMNAQGTPSIAKYVWIPR